MSESLPLNCLYLIGIYLGSYQAYETFAEVVEDRLLSDEAILKRALEMFALCKVQVTSPFFTGTVHIVYNPVWAYAIDITQTVVHQTQLPHSFLRYRILYNGKMLAPYSRVSRDTLPYNAALTLE